ncbi:MAG: HAD hydrolase-like protein, partial [Pseudomonadota bacterium]
PVQDVRKHLNSAENQQVWFVGDADVDMRCAQNSNCVGVLIHGTSEGRMAHAAIPAGTDMVVVDLPTLDSHLRTGRVA